MGFATLLINRLEQAVLFVNRMLTEAPRLSEFFEVLDTEPAGVRPVGCHGFGRLRGCGVQRRLVLLRRRSAVVD